MSDSHDDSLSDADKKHISGNLKLARTFVKEIIAGEHEDLPDSATVVLLPEGDADLARMNRALADHIEYESRRPVERVVIRDDGR